MPGAARVRAHHLVHHHETALWRARPRGSVRRARGAGGARSDRSACRALPSLPRRVRACVAPRSRAVEHDARARDPAGARPARAAAPLPRRAGPRAPRRPARAAARMPRRPRRSASCRSGTTSSSRGRIGRACSPRQYRKTVIGMNGDVAQTFLVDGFVAGTWRVEGGRVVDRAVRDVVAPGAARARGRGRTPGSVPRRLSMRRSRLPLDVAPPRGAGLGSAS